MTEQTMPKTRSSVWIALPIAALAIAVGVLLVLAVVNGQVPKMTVEEIVGSTAALGEIQVEGMPLEETRRYNAQGELLFDMVGMGKLDRETRVPLAGAKRMAVRVTTREIPDNLWRTGPDDDSFKQVRLVGRFDRDAGEFVAHTVQVKCESRYDPASKSLEYQKKRKIQP